MPRGTGATSAIAEEFLRALSPSAYPLAFEVAGGAEEIAVQVACREPDTPLLTHQLRAFFPDAVVVPRGEALVRAWAAAGEWCSILEFGLAREFMLPLRTFRDFRPDPLTPVFGALSEVEKGECGIFQVLFEAARNPWGESVLRAVYDAHGEPFFLDAPEFSTLARDKVSRPLYTAVLRVAVRAEEGERVLTLLRGLVGALGHFGVEDGNDLTPLVSDDLESLEADLLARTSHRTGMLLGSHELVSFVHLPHESLRLAKLPREMRTTKAPPLLAMGVGVELGVNEHEGETRPVRLPRDLRMRHMHVVGASGTGKSTLLIRMIQGDIEAGEGVGVIDPHGDLVDEILARIPEKREGDVILFDPADEEMAVGWNMLEARSEVEKTLLASDLVGVFRRLSTSWGDQMTSVLGNAILAILESERGGTLLDLRRFLVDREFRAEFLGTVRDPEVVFYWQREFPLLRGIPQGPILTRLDTFLRPKLVRRVVVERENRLDFRGIVDEGKIFLAKLAQGAIGEENAALLGSLLVSKFHQVALSRADTAPTARRHFFLTVDEFQEVMTPSMASLLTGARKYRLGLTLAHQELRQLEARNREVLGALLANAATRVVFRVGEDDARHLERGFAAFEARDLVSLGVGEAVARLERADWDFNLRTRALPSLDPAQAHARREGLLALLRAKFPRKPEEAAETPSAPLPAPREAPEPETPAPLPPREPARRERRAPTPPAPLGRGGPEHKYLQELVKRFAESKGYLATIEQALEGGGSVDVALAREGLKIACEISITSTVEQEVGNVRKCLEANFDYVVLLARDRGTLKKMEAALRTRLPETALPRVLFYTPDEFLAFLETLPEAPGEETVGGYKVKVRYQPGEPQGNDSKTRAVSEVIFRSLRRMKEKKE